MDAAALIARLELMPSGLEALLARLPDADWRWRPPEGGWSLLEIVNHLVDEEVEDFRARTRSTLEDPSRAWDAFDPEGAVTAREYNARDPLASLQRYRDERATSVAWLRSLAAPKWDRARSHPRAGPIHAADLLAAWAAHDARHLAQVARRLHALAARDGAPYSVAYAG